MKILFLSAWFPYPADNGSKLRIYNLLRGLARKHEVTLISFADPVPEQTPPELLVICPRVYTLPTTDYQPGSRKAFLGLFQSRPRVLVDRYSPEMLNLIRQVLRDEHYDVVIASQWYMADYLEAIPGIPAVFEEVEVGVFRDKVRQAPSPVHRFRHELTTLKMRIYFQRLLNRFGACTVVSEDEQRLLSEIVPGYHSIELVPNGVNLEDYQAEWQEPAQNQLIFTGSFTYSPNYQAMRWFMGEVFPSLREQVPDLKVVITGNHADLSLPCEESVVRTGFVEDIRPVVAASWASLAPLHTGGGTRLKILEAMALKTPVISTSKGAEGLDVRSGEHLLIADTAPEFAKAVIRLLREPGLRTTVAGNAYELVAEKYDWPVIMPKFNELVERVAFIREGV